MKEVNHIHWAVKEVIRLAFLILFYHGFWVWSQKRQRSDYVRIGFAYVKKLVHCAILVFLKHLINSYVIHHT